MLLAGLGDICVYSGLTTALSISLPVSDVFCCESSSSSDSELRSRSLPPFSKLLLELPVEVWDTPNLEVRNNGETKVSREKSEILGVLDIRHETKMRFTLFWI